MKVFTTHYHSIILTSYTFHRTLSGRNKNKEKQKGIVYHETKLNVSVMQKLTINLFGVAHPAVRQLSTLT